MEPSDYEAKGLFIFSVIWAYFEGEITTLLHMESIDDSACYSLLQPLTMQYPSQPSAQESEKIAPSVWD